MKHFDSLKEKNKISPLDSSFYFLSFVMTKTKKNTRVKNKILSHVNKY